MLLSKTINSDGGFCAAPVYVAANEDRACLVKSPKFTIQITLASFKLQLRCCGNDDISNFHILSTFQRETCTDTSAHICLL